MKIVNAFRRRVTNWIAINNLYLGIVENLFYGAIHKIHDARGGRGGGGFESHSVTRGAAQAVWRDGEAHREKFIPVYISQNKTVLANICPSDDKLIFSIKILLPTLPSWNTALPFNQQTSENLSGKLFRLRFNRNSVDL
jgi:hypothetical protein